MKQVELIIKKISSYIVVLPLLLFTFCQTAETEVVNIEEIKITKEHKVVAFMRQVASDNLDATAKSFNSTPSCTGFAYPLTFTVTFLNVEVPKEVTINNDAELIDFFNELTTSDSFTVIFPVVLLDIDGNETMIYSIEELEGTLQFAIDACDDSFPDDDEEDNDDDEDSDDDSDNDDSDQEYEYCDNKGKKVYICHNTSDGGAHTICVSVNAIWAHVNNHDDELGRCEN